MGRQSGFFDVEDRLKRLTDLGDHFEAFVAAVDFDLFRPALNAALAYANGSRGGRPSSPSKSARASPPPHPRPSVQAAAVIRRGREGSNWTWKPLFREYHRRRFHMHRQTNAAPKPFVWTKTADVVLAGIGPSCQRISNSDH